MEFFDQLQQSQKLIIQQKYELAEFLGFETRNKYAILNEAQVEIGFAAEQQKGLFGFLIRQFLGHWRSFEVYIFDSKRQLVLKCKHPFRFIFNRFDIYSHNGEKLGALQQRFSLFSKKFDVLNNQDQLTLSMKSPLWRIWTFKFFRNNQETARIEKKWSGIFAEGFSDKDKFQLSFNNQNFSLQEKSLLLSACLFVDLMYFEKKAQ